MAVTLIINPGSSSKKYSLVRDGRVVCTFRFERNEQYYDICKEQQGLEQKCEGITAEIYRSSLEHVLTVAIADGIIDNAEAITRVGVRVVAPGTYFQSHRVVDELYLHKLEMCSPVAPLHIPHTLALLHEVQLLLPAATLVGVSDSAFHATLPESVRTYPIEVADTKEFDLYRFGYHGLSYASLARQLPTLLGSKASNVVACHIGSGMSMTALRNGVSVDTTMGFGPGSGLMMGARSGDIEPAVLLELMRVKHMKSLDIQTYLQTRGGFVGLTGESDFRHLLLRYEQGDAVAIAAFEQCITRFQKMLGAYFVTLQGIDAIVLTATAVERSPVLRALLLRDLSWMGIMLDNERNDELHGHDGIITTAASPITVAVVRANEFSELLSVTQSFAEVT